MDVKHVLREMQQQLAELHTHKAGMFKCNEPIMKDFPLPQEHTITTHFLLQSCHRILISSAGRM